MFQTAMGWVLVSTRRSDLHQKMPLCDAGISFPCLSNVQKLKKDGVVPGSGVNINLEHIYIIIYMSYVTSIACFH